VNIAITGRHHVPEAPVRDYIHEKLGRVFRLCTRLTDAHVRVDRSHGIFRVDAQVGAPRHQTFVARGESADLRGAIDGVEAKLEAQIRQWKDRMQGRR
jgi:ribosomal subunit interface protein